MALDIYIIPLNKFFSGNYTSPLEKAYGAKAIRMGSQKGEASSEDAIDSVTDLQNGLMTTLGLDFTWKDEGETIGEQFDYNAFNALRAFAAHQDYPKTKGLFQKTSLAFDPSEDLTKHPGIKKIYKGANSPFQHLVKHADNQGFWFPVDFEKPINLNRSAGLLAGSSIHLRNELRQIK